MNDAVRGFGRDLDGMLDQPGEAVADRVNCPAVEAEDGLVEVALQVLGPNGAMGVPSSQRLAKLKTK